MSEPDDTGNEEFFIGWQGKAPEKTGRFLRGRLVAAIFVTLVAGLAFAGLQRTIGKAWFEYGNIREFSGLLVKSPVPMLLTESPDEQSGESVYLLVNPFKHGYPLEQAETYDLKPVTIRGTLIYNEGGGAMIEVVETLARETEGSLSGLELKPSGETRVELDGEIVDSKCWLGVMNPGALKPHRACAINCIRGGIPPVLLVDRKEFYIMVGPEGEPINEEVLEHVALPVTVPGTVVDYGKLKVLMVNPAKIRQTAE
jgi:hypothetical protein